MSYVLLSGGLDSVVMCHEAHKNNPSLKAIYVNHGQKGSPGELASAKAVAAKLGMNLKIIDLSGCWPSFADVAGDRAGPTTSSAIALNAGLLMALNYVAWAGGKKVKVGLIKDDLDGRPWLIEMFEKYIEATQLIRPSLTGVPPGGDEYEGLEFEFPLAAHSKSEVIELGIRLGVDLSSSQTCQFEETTHCGKCYLCKARKDSFKRANVTDNTTYLL